MKRVLALVVLATVSGCLVAFLPGTSARGATGTLFAHVYVDNLGPLTSCTPTPDNNCPLSSVLHWYVYVANANRPMQFTGPSPDRTTLANAYVVKSVDETMTINGVPSDTGWGPSPTTMTPPPSPFPLPWAGRWPVSVTCPGGSCTDVQTTAVLPGENLAILYGGWGHGVGEASGIYVFSFTIRGTLNGTPTDLYASTPPISML